MKANTRTHHARFFGAACTVIAAVSCVTPHRIKARPESGNLPTGSVTFFSGDAGVSALEAPSGVRARLLFRKLYEIDGVKYFALWVVAGRQDDYQPAIVNTPPDAVTTPQVAYVSTKDEMIVTPPPPACRRPQTGLARHRHEQGRDGGRGVPGAAALDRG